MKVRVAGQDEGTALRRAREAVRCAEAAGFDDAWIAEHHFLSYGTCPSAITFAAHALGAIAKSLGGRSSGAVRNALGKLVAAGTAVKAKEAPRRYALAPTEQAAATRSAR